LKPAGQAGVEPAPAGINDGVSGLRLALAGDTMLGRKVAEAIRTGRPEALVGPGVSRLAREADLFVLNLECCIAERGEPWPDPEKPFFFRAPPEAVAVLDHLGVDCVTLANNHALDFGAEALLETLDHLGAAGIAAVGAGADRERARRPAVLERRGFRLAVLGCSDHPAAYAAKADTPGIAYGLDWVPEALARPDADAVLVSPHWGPNMVAAPLARVREAARAMRAGGATLVAGHSAHVFHGVSEGVLYDLGDFLDDYAVDPRLRNDLGLLFLVDLDRWGPTRVEAVPLKLEFCRARLATDEDVAWIRDRFRAACRSLGTEAFVDGDRLVVDWRG
jgi:poly-gamma-glutamate capsule biosynthesis protein CapA/YwtB (metallophosphatase superfamily)